MSETIEIEHTESETLVRGILSEIVLNICKDVEKEEITDNIEIKEAEIITESSETVTTDVVTEIILTEESELKTNEVNLTQERTNELNDTCQSIEMSETIEIEFTESETLVKGILSEIVLNICKDDKNEEITDNIEIKEAKIITESSETEIITESSEIVTTDVVTEIILTEESELKTDVTSTTNEEIDTCQNIEMSETIEIELTKSETLVRGILSEIVLSICKDDEKEEITDNIEKKEIETITESSEIVTTDVVTEIILTEETELKTDVTSTTNEENLTQENADPVVTIEQDIKEKETHLIIAESEVVDEDNENQQICDKELSETEKENLLNKHSIISTEENQELLTTSIIVISTEINESKITEAENNLTGKEKDKTVSESEHLENNVVLIVDSESNSQKTVTDSNDILIKDENIKKERVDKNDEFYFLEKLPKFRTFSLSYKKSIFDSEKNEHNDKINENSEQIQSIEKESINQKKPKFGKAPFSKSYSASDLFDRNNNSQNNSSFKMNAVELNIHHQEEAKDFTQTELILDKDNRKYDNFEHSETIPVDNSNIGIESENIKTETGEISEIIVITNETKVVTVTEETDENNQELSETNKAENLEENKLIELNGSKTELLNVSSTEIISENNEIRSIEIENETINMTSVTVENTEIKSDEIESQVTEIKEGEIDINKSDEEVKVEQSVVENNEIKSDEMENERVEHEKIITTEKEINESETEKIDIKSSEIIDIEETHEAVNETIIEEKNEQITNEIISTSLEEGINETKVSEEKIDSSEANENTTENNITFVEKISNEDNKLEESIELREEKQENKITEAEFQQNEMKLVETNKISETFTENEMIFTSTVEENSEQEVTTDIIISSHENNEMGSSEALKVTEGIMESSEIVTEEDKTQEYDAEVINETNEKETINVGTSFNEVASSDPTEIKSETNEILYIETGEEKNDKHENKSMLIVVVSTDIKEKLDEIEESEMTEDGNKIDVTKMMVENINNNVHEKSQENLDRFDENLINDTSQQSHADQIKIEEESKQLEINESHSEILEIKEKTDIESVAEDKIYISDANKDIDDDKITDSKSAMEHNEVMFDKEKKLVEENLDIETKEETVIKEDMKLVTILKTDDIEVSKEESKEEIIISSSSIEETHTQMKIQEIDETSKQKNIKNLSYDSNLDEGKPITLETNNSSLIVNGILENIINDVTEKYLTEKSQNELQTYESISVSKEEIHIKEEREHTEMNVESQNQVNIEGTVEKEKEISETNLKSETNLVTLSPIKSTPLHESKVEGRKMSIQERQNRRESQVSLSYKKKMSLSENILIPDKTPIIIKSQSPEKLEKPKEKKVPITKTRKHSNKRLSLDIYNKDENIITKRKSVDITAYGKSKRSSVSVISENVSENKIEMKVSDKTADDIEIIEKPHDEIQEEAVEIKSEFHVEAEAETVTENDNTTSIELTENDEVKLDNEQKLDSTEVETENMVKQTVLEVKTDEISDISENNKETLEVSARRLSLEQSQVSKIEKDSDETKFESVDENSKVIHQYSSAEELSQEKQISLTKPHKAASFETTEQNEIKLEESQKENENLIENTEETDIQIQYKEESIINDETNSKTLINTEVDITNENNEVVKQEDLYKESAEDRTKEEEEIINVELKHEEETTNIINENEEVYSNLESKQMIVETAEIPVEKNKTNQFESETSFIQTIEVKDETSNKSDESESLATEKKKPWIIESWDHNENIKSEEEESKKEEILIENEPVDEVSIATSQSVKTDDMKLELRKKIRKPSYKPDPVENYIHNVEQDESKIKTKKTEEQKIKKKNESHSKEKIEQKDVHETNGKKFKLRDTVAKNKIQISEEKETTVTTHKKVEKKKEKIDRRDKTEKFSKTTSDDFEFRRIKSNIEILKIQVQQNKQEKKDFVPYIYNDLQPYGDTTMYENLKVKKPKSATITTSRATAVDLCDPWESYQMDKLILPPIRMSSSFAGSRSQTHIRRSHDREKSADNQAISQRNDLFRKQAFQDTKEPSYQNGDRRLESHKQTSQLSPRKVEEHNQKTKSDLNRLSVNKANSQNTTNGRNSLSRSLFVYQQNSHGSKKASTETVKEKYKDK